MFVCGITGAVSLIGENVVSDVCQMTEELQNRGQEGFGIGYSNRKEVKVKKDYIIDNLKTFIREKNIKSHRAIGHTRYSTSGSKNDFKELQPIKNPNPKFPFTAIVHNGTVDEELLDKALKINNVSLEGYPKNDTGKIAALIQRDGDKNIVENLKEAIQKGYLRGAYSLLIITRNKFIAARDLNCIRPLLWVKKGDTYYFASEDCAFGLLGVKEEEIEEVQPGEIIIIQNGKIKREQVVLAGEVSFCSFEEIYLARPDSGIYVMQDKKSIEGKRKRQVDDVRELLGRAAAKEFIRLHQDILERWREMKVNDELDEVIVTGIPDSGTPAALGFIIEFNAYMRRLHSNPYSWYSSCFVKVRAKRSFMDKDQSRRRRTVEEKLRILNRNVKNKVLIVVDDSIVRGNTSRRIVEYLKDNGAKEVHMVSSSPKIKFPCFLGVDTAEAKQLIAAVIEKDEDIAKSLGADSITYLPYLDLKSSLPCPKNHCYGCFDGEYPVPIPSYIQKQIDELNNNT